MSESFDVMIICKDNIIMIIIILILIIIIIIQVSEMSEIMTNFINNNIII
jgi:hypothetical protein